MRFTIKARQVAGVTSIVAAAVVALSAIHLTSLARVRLEETQSRGQMLSRAIYQRAREVVPEADDPYAALAADPGIRSLLESSIAYSNDVSYAAISDATGFAIAHSTPSEQGEPLPLQGDLEALLQRGPLAQLRAIYSDRTFELKQALLLGEERFGSIRIGVSTLLIRSELQRALQPAALTALAALGIAMLVATLLAQWILRPIHVIRSGLSRLGRGEFGVTLDLPPGAEFQDLDSSFKVISEQLSSARTRSDQSANLESVVQRLEDAVAMFDPEGRLLFANRAMRVALPGVPTGESIREALPDTHPYRRLVEDTLRTGTSQGPLSAAIGNGAEGAAAEERLLVTHGIEGPDHQFLGVMLLARDLGYLSQLQSTIRYSRKQAALGRLLAGVAHEVKNPLNAMTIHLELLKQKLAAATRGVPVVAMGEQNPAGRAAGAAFSSIEPPRNSTDVVKHVNVIGSEIRRLDQVMQDFLKFARPEELKPQPVQMGNLFDEMRPLIEPEAQKAQVRIEMECSTDLPPVSGDPGMLKQVFLNLAINACQAMPNGGTLRVACQATSGRRVQVDVADTGSGIQPEHLERIFDLYFTTKEKGSGVGLSLAYRIIQLHDGEIEVESTPGRGTTFRVLLPQA